MKGILLRAVTDKKPLEMIYMSKDNRISQRVIRVIAVNDTKVKAYCYTKNQYRVFNIDNILSVAPAKRRVGA